MNKQLCAHLCSALLMVAGTSATFHAEGIEQSVDECSKELLLAYFPQPFVKETLKKFNVSEDEWDDIQQELAGKDREVIKIVEQKASDMDPNPLKDPQERQAAVKLFRETLFQVFSDVMHAHNISDDRQIQSMLDDIQQQKAQRFVQCMQKSDARPNEYKKSPEADEDR